MPITKEETVVLGDFYYHLENGGVYVKVLAKHSPHYGCPATTLEISDSINDIDHVFRLRQVTPRMLKQMGELLLTAAVKLEQEQQKY